MADAEKPGYTDTPIIPGSIYRVHDAERPQPPIVTPGVQASLGAPMAPPSDAVILFDGTDLSGWYGKEKSEAKWVVRDGYMEVLPKSGNIQTKVEFGDCQLHVEFSWWPLQHSFGPAISRQFWSAR